MKKILFTLMMIMVLSISVSSAATLGVSSIRENTRFLTDKMAYELSLNRNQIEDVYEVNYDFVTNVQYLMDDVVMGDRNAISDYYNYLDNRNDDLRWILSDSQYRKFMTIEYFNKPLYTYNNSWSFRVFNIYTNLKHFYFSRPRHYYSYSGSHYRGLFNNDSYYRMHCSNRYGHKHFYDRPFSVRPNHYQKPSHVIIGRPSRPIVVKPVVKPVVRPVIVKPSHSHNKPVTLPSNRPVTLPSNRPVNGSNVNRPDNRPENRPTERPSVSNDKRYGLDRVTNRSSYNRENSNTVTRSSSDDSNRTSTSNSERTSGRRR